MRTARLLASLLLIAAHAMAQDAMPHETRGGGSDESTTAEAIMNPVAPAVLADTPAPRVIDKKFIFVMGALGGAESLRFTTRKLVLDHEFAAAAPWVTSVPSKRAPGRQVRGTLRT